MGGGLGREGGMDRVYTSSPLLERILVNFKYIAHYYLSVLYFSLPICIFRIVAYANFSFLVTIDPVHIFPIDEEPVVFNYVVRHSDAYDNTTGIYTAPLDGDYEFMLHALCNNDTTIEIYMVVDGVMVNFAVLPNLGAQF